MNITKYLNRLRIAEKQAPSLEFLKTLQKAHLFNIPFENLDIHYGRKISLDINYLLKIIVGAFAMNLIVYFMNYYPYSVLM